jgi:response regulator RpfG family c-di-GMP phosphodiesterase
MKPESALLIVDDEKNVLNSMKRLLRGKSYRVYTATSAAEGLELLQRRHICVTISDHLMPEMDGITFLEHVRQRRPHVVRILMTAYGSLENAMAAIKRCRIFEYVTKPWNDAVLKSCISRAFEHHALLEENRRLQQITREQNEELKTINDDLEDLVRVRTCQLEEAVREGILMLAMASEARDDMTGGHIRRIQHLTRRICRQLGLDADTTEEISFASILHDVGKIHIPDHILKKPGPLTDGEFALMQTHTVVGERILGDKPFYETTRRIARHHHEHWDGSGYPDGLKADAIPLAARIVTVADVYDALIHERPYKPAWKPEKALAVMEVFSGKIFDPGILGVFLEMEKASINPLPLQLEEEVASLQHALR